MYFGSPVIACNQSMTYPGPFTPLRLTSRTRTCVICIDFARPAIVCPCWRMRRVIWLPVSACIWAFLVAVKPTHLLTYCEVLERICVPDGLSVELMLDVAAVKFRHDEKGVRALCNVIS